MTPPALDLWERWAPVPDFPNYMVSDYGRVWSRPRHRTKGGILKPGAVTRANSRWPTDPYLQVGLRHEGGKRKYWYVHRLVLTVFVRAANPGEEGHHRDNDTTNNRLGNLEWTTHAENIAAKYQHTEIEGVPF